MPTVIKGRLLDRPCLTLENEYLKLTLLEDTGEIFELFSKRTGHEHLLVDENFLLRELPRWGIRDESLGKSPCKTEALEEEKDAVIRVKQSYNGLRHLKEYRLKDGSSRVRVKVKITNTSREVKTARNKVSYNLAPGGEIGVGVYAGKRATITVPHFGHKIFVGTKPEWPDDFYFQSFEPVEQTYEILSFKQYSWPDPHWIAFIDTVQDEGIAIKFNSPTSAVEVWHQAHHFPTSIYMEHSSSTVKLQPGESLEYEYEMIVFNGLKRVDYVGEGFLIGFDLIRTLLPREVQRVKLNVLGVEEAKVNANVNIVSDVEEIKKDISLGLRPFQLDTSTFEVGPYQDRIDKLWYYLGKFTGEVGRPVPRVLVKVAGDIFERKFIVSPEAEHVLSKMNSYLEAAKKRHWEGAFSSEGLGGLLALRELAEEHRLNTDDMERLYLIYEKMNAIWKAFNDGGDWRLFPSKEAKDSVLREPVKSWSERIRDYAEKMLGEPVKMSYPGRGATGESYNFAEMAVTCSFCYATTGEERFGRKALGILMELAEINKSYGITNGGHVLQISIQTPDYVLAYDLIHDLLTPEEHAKILRYFFWLADWLEPFASVTGHNDEPAEACASTWVSARFRYLPDSDRRLLRALGIFQKHLQQFVNSDGDWPEAPSYNELVTRLYYLAAEAFLRVGINLYEEVDGKSIGQMAKWLQIVCTQNLIIPQLGDTLWRNPSPWPFILAAKRYNEPEYLEYGLRLCEKALALLIYPYKIPYWSIPKIHPLALISYPHGMKAKRMELPVSQVLPATGYVILRSGFEPEDQYLILDYGPHKIGHGHLDKLSFELHAHGQPLAIDAGYGIYDTSLHNTITVDNKSQPKLKGNLLLFQSQPGTDFVRAEAQVQAGVFHKRGVVYRRNSFFLIHDVIKSEDEHLYTWALHFDGELKHLDDHFDVEKEGVNLFTVVLDKETEVKVGKGQKAIQVAIGKEAHLDRKEIPRISMEKRSKEAQFGVVMIPYKGEKPKVSTATNWQGKTFSADLLIDGRKHLVIVNDTEGEARRGDITTDGEMCLYTKLEGYLAAAKVSRIQVGGESLLSSRDKLESLEIDCKKKLITVQSPSPTRIEISPCKGFEALGKRLNIPVKSGVTQVSLG